jgi:hypothetical protein
MVVEFDSRHLASQGEDWKIWRNTRGVKHPWPPWRDSGDLDRARFCSSAVAVDYCGWNLVFWSENQVESKKALVGASGTHKPSFGARRSRDRDAIV